MSTAAPSRAAVTIRRAKPEDAPACGQICYDAFYKISTDHDFPPDLPSPEIGVGLLTQIFSHSGFYCVVAEADGRIAGSNCLDERDAIAGIGPITIDPKTQNRGIGRKLMDAVLDRARQRNFAGVRLVQAAFHNRSLSLYTSLGFDVREPLATIQGPSLKNNSAIKKTYEGYTVRPAQASDIEACNQVALRVHGHHRGGELADAIRQGTATVVERHGRITGYASSLAFFGHAVAETNPDLQAIIAAADSFGGPGILVPSRNSELFRWCLGNGLRVVQPMTLMSVGLYNEPKGAFLPSVTY
jgi:predicted N-acetyltransferase YhbS